MNKHVLKITFTLCTALGLTALPCAAALAAESAEKAEAERRALETAKMAEERRALEEEYRQQREDMLVAIEQARAEADEAAATARAKAERLKAETERLRAIEEKAYRDAGEVRRERVREIENARREISRTHRELQRATREVARAHRDLIVSEDRHLRTRLINLGDRPMLGVVLGDATDNGIRIIGLSPDGPAERAGLQSGDILVSLRGERVADEGGRETIYTVLSEVGEGEEIRVEFLRDGEIMTVMLEPEKREPSSWASYIRIPEAPTVAGAVPVVPDAPHAPGAPPAHVIMEQIVVPSVDTAELAAQAEAMAEEFEVFRAVIAGSGKWEVDWTRDFELGEFEYEFDTSDFEALGESALSHARLWLGASATLGIRFTELNEGLAGYFGTDRGVLVLEASNTNPLQLKAGDVLLSIGDENIEAAADVVRALRAYESGDSIRIAIKRQQRDELLEVIMPEDRFGP